MQLEIAQSTPTANSIAAFVQARVGLGEIVESEFIRRSFNQAYRLKFASVRRVVAVSVPPTAWWTQCVV
ncbi:hypothetical protein [Limnohabitans sp.]|jgi:hypothetical protein|uniref:hypothetical protein n=1 Tax=Limnohabitans sp. TaxID=1907725 RepID=UPI0037BEBCC4